MQILNISNQDKFDEAVDVISRAAVDVGVFMTSRTIEDTETKETYLDRINIMTPEFVVFSFEICSLDSAGVDTKPLSDILESTSSLVVVMDISEASMPLQIHGNFGRRYIGEKSFAVPLYGLYDLSVADSMTTGHGYDKNIDTVNGFFKKYGLQPVESHASQDLEILTRLPDLYVAIRTKIRDLGLEKSFATESYAAAEFGAMTSNGQRLNMDLWKDLIQSTQAKISLVKKRLNQYLASVITIDDNDNPDVNYDSPEQMLFVLKSLNFKVDGKLIDSTDAGTLKKLSHPVADLLMEYRSLTKFLSTYGQKYINAINPKTGRIHFKYRSYGTVTRRPTCHGGLNALNIPKESVLRSAFTADIGCLLSKGDWSAQEVWILASLSGDTEMLKGLQEHDDFMTYAAELFLGMNLSAHDRPLRQAVKVVIYGLNYGAEEIGLQEDIKNKAGIDMSIGEIRNLISSYKSKFWRATKFLDSCSEKAADDLQLRIAGTYRIWSPPGPNVNEWAYKNHIKRAARNHPLQTYGSLMSKRAQHLINIELLKRNLPAFFVANIYDELVVQTTEAVSEEVHNIHIEGMHQASLDCIKLNGKVSGRLSYTWGDE